jgi:hypothetical protein
MGVAAVSARRTDIPGIAVWEDAPLPPLAPLYCGIYLSEGADRQMLENLADLIFKVIGPQKDCMHNPMPDTADVLAHL